MNGDAVSTTRRPLRAYLLWLVLATPLPGIVGVALLFVHQYQKARAQFEKNTMRTVYALVHTVESKLLRGQAIAQTLSTAEALEHEDFARVHRQAREALSLTGAGMNAVLRDRRGQQVMNTAVDFGVPLPLDHSAQIDKVFATGKPSVANVFTGAVQRRPIASVDVPVLVRGEIAYVLSIGLRPDCFEDVLTPKSVPDGAVASIFDAKGVIFGRNVNAGSVIGQRVTDSLFKAIQRSREGVFGATTQEGRDVLTFYSRSEPTGWRVAVGVPRASLIQALLEPLALLLTARRSCSPSACGWPGKSACVWSARAPSPSARANRPRPSAKPTSGKRPRCCRCTWPPTGTRCWSRTRRCGPWNARPASRRTCACSTSACLTSTATNWRAACAPTRARARR